MNIKFQKGCMTQMITVNNVSKDFKIARRRNGLDGAVKDLFHREYVTKSAVKEVSFSIPMGEIVGFIGPNGAGKSTTIKMMTGILVPDSGRIVVDGLEPYKNRKENAKKMGVVFGQRTQLWWDIPVTDTMELLKQMYRIPEAEYKKNLDMLNSVLGLDKFADKAVRQLSLGQRMRADLACAMLHSPDFLYLDEPTIGLDVLVKRDIREFIRCINEERRTTIILTTHDMDDIEKLCKRVLVINEGSLMYDGNIDYLRKNYGSRKKMTLFLTAELCLDTKEKLANMGLDYKLEENKVEVLFDPERIHAMELMDIMKVRNEIVDFNVSQAEIDIVIQNLYANMMGDGGAE